jgi:hypothetical protein
MRNADVSKRSPSRSVAAVIAAALLLAVPLATAHAEDKAAAAAAKAPAAPVAPAAAPAPAPVAPAAAPPVAAPVALGPVAEPAPTVIIRTEVYGQMISRFGKAAKFLSLVSTSTEPLPAGAKGLLFRRIEEPGKMPYYVEIAEVSVKKIDATGKFEITIENEKKDVLVNGKKADHFKKSTKVKLQVDRPG